MNKKRGRPLPAVLAAVLTLCMVGSFRAETSSAYFTTYALARGGAELSLGPTRNRIREDFADWTKKAHITNEGEHDCFVRALVLAPEGFELDYSGTDARWSYHREDGYWYYSEVLHPGEEAGVLSVYIKVPEELAYSFDVVVLDEFTMVRYDESGEPRADWKWQKGSDVE